MTSEDIAASVVLPSVDGKVISSQSTGDENSKNTLDTSVIIRSSTLQEGENTEPAPCLTLVKGHIVHNSVTKSFLKGDSRENPIDRDVLQGNTCISHKLDYLNINNNIFERTCKTNLGFNQFCKSYNPLKGNNICLEPKIPAVLTEIKFKVDRSSVEGRALEGQLVVDDRCADGVCGIPALHISYSTQQRALCSSNNQCILGSHLQTMSSNCCDRFVSSSAHLNEQHKSCGREDGHTGLYEASHLVNNLSRSYLKTTPVFSGDITYGQNLPCVMYAKPLQSKDNHESYMDEIDHNLSRNRKDRSALLIRRFCKNYKEVKKSVYTGTSAIVKSLPSGHIGTRACCYVESNQESTNELKCSWLTAKRLTSVQGSVRSKDFLCYLVKMTMCQNAEFKTNESNPRSQRRYSSVDLNRNDSQM